jgi:hypothetical protein
MVASHIMPLDAISIEVVEDSEANLWMGRIVSSSTIVRLRKTGPSSVRPVQTLVEWDGTAFRIVPIHDSVGVIHLSTSPEISLRLLSNQPVKEVLLVGAVQGDRVHPHGLAVLLGLVLLEGGAADLRLPGGHVASPDIVSRISPEMVGSRRATEAGASHHPGGGRLIRGSRVEPRSFRGWS